MLDALRQNRVAGAVDTADRAPIAVPYPDPVLASPEWPSRRMHRKRVGGKSLHASK